MARSPVLDGGLREVKRSMFEPLLAYIGPETMLPLTSVLAGVMGVAMMFGRNVLRGIGRIFRRPPRSY